MENALNLYYFCLFSVQHLAGKKSHQAKNGSLTVGTQFRVSSFLSLYLYDSGKHHFLFENEKYIENNVFNIQ